MNSCLCCITNPCCTILWQEYLMWVDRKQESCLCLGILILQALSIIFKSETSRRSELVQTGLDFSTKRLHSYVGGGGKWNSVVTICVCISHTCLCWSESWKGPIWAHSRRFWFSNSRVTTGNLCFKNIPSDLDATDLGLTFWECSVQKWFLISLYKKGKR